MSVLEITFLVIIVILTFFVVILCFGFFGNNEIDKEDSKLVDIMKNNNNVLSTSNQTNKTSNRVHSYTIKRNITVELAKNHYLDIDMTKHINLSKLAETYKDIIDILDIEHYECWDVRYYYIDEVNIEHTIDEFETDIDNDDVDNKEFQSLPTNEVVKLSFEELEQQFPNISYIVNKLIDKYKLNRR